MIYHHASWGSAAAITTQWWLVLITDCCSAGRCRRCQRSGVIVTLGPYMITEAHVSSRIGLNGEQYPTQEAHRSRSWDGVARQIRHRCADAFTFESRYSQAEWRFLSVIGRFSRRPFSHSMKNLLHLSRSRSDTHERTVGGAVDTNMRLCVVTDRMTSPKAPAGE